MKHEAWECSALRDVSIVLCTYKTYPKRRDYLFSFNLNLDLLTLALENLYFNTLDREKVHGKCLGCIKSRDHLPHVLYTHATESHHRGMKEPRVADPWPSWTVQPNPQTDAVKSGSWGQARLGPHAAICTVWYTEGTSGFDRLHPFRATGRPPAPGAAGCSERNVGTTAYALPLRDWTCERDERIN